MSSQWANLQRVLGGGIRACLLYTSATTSRQVFVSYALPLVLISICMVLVNLFVCLVLGKRWLQDNPFETCLLYTSGHGT